MKNILCPTDFSNTATNAIVYAAKLAQVIGGQLTLFNVHHDTHDKDLSKETALRQLQALAKELNESYGTLCFAEVDTTKHPISKCIGARAQHHDLIVMGTNGPDNLYEFFAGSNTYNAIIKTNVPLLLIPAECEFRNIKSTVFAFDYLTEGKLPLGQLAQFVKQVKSQLSILQVMEESYSFDADEDLKRVQELVKISSEDEVDFQFASIHSADIVNSINSYILENNIDILALCTKSRNLLENTFHKSVIKALSTIASYPVFVFHR